MSRCFVRSLPLLVLFVLFSASAKADTFQMSFTQSNGTVLGTGQFTTDGVCSLCSPTSGLLTWVVEIGPDTGLNAFDIVDDGPATKSITYDRLTNTLASIGTFNSENRDFFIFFSDGNWQLSTLNGDFSGTYAVTPVGVPEPPIPALLSLTPIVLMGLSMRRRWRSVGTPWFL